MAEEAEVPAEQTEFSRESPLGPHNKPEWLHTVVGGYWTCPDGTLHDLHHHDHNQLYLVCAGKAKILNAGREIYVKTGDIVAIRAGDDHDVLETYGDEVFAKFFLYEGPAAVDDPRFGHLHPPGDPRELHPVPNLPVPADFPIDYDAAAAAEGSRRWVKGLGLASDQQDAD
jgi:mannose-6-phosphate isomerase-like protein (cupin superfamily)